VTLDHANTLAANIDNVCYQYRTGMLDDERWQVQRAILVGLFVSPGVIEWWRSYQQDVSPQFVALVEKILAEETERAGGAQG
jgi:hypothetical protein